MININNKVIVSNYCKTDCYQRVISDQVDCGCGCRLVLKFNNYTEGILIHYNGRHWHYKCLIEYLLKLEDKLNNNIELLKEDNNTLRDLITNETNNLSNILDYLEDYSTLVYERVKYIKEVIRGSIDKHREALKNLIGF